MRQATEWLDRHLWVYALLSWLSATGVLVLLSPDRSLLSAALRAAGMTAIAMGILTYRRRKDCEAMGAGEDRLVSRDRQLQRGEVPKDEAGREEMRRLVAKRRHTSRHLKWLLPLWCLMMGGIALLMLVGPLGPRYVWAGAGVVVFIAWFVWVARRTRTRLTAMERALGTASSAEEPERAGRR
ncbi:hypothetical protein [Streptomyces candidus]|uniref:Flp pilus assembly protein TadB n=1 Tax=Streptomyces candidus TaxID=67283 RepID=A0A7X0HD62_9ACTN|nr:hypothetical protein [Streptomyces candidus]MBB6434359.1 Flp pilus assembly protein TadB [Streptomyces candidus]GHH36952.1 hypothetical protein GCM10018773_12990 [Streptomyces candidus]